jgi:hypothetical protein
MAENHQQLPSCLSGSAVMAIIISHDAIPGDTLRLATNPPTHCFQGFLKFHSIFQSAGCDFCALEESALDGADTCIRGTNMGLLKESPFDGR